MILHERIESITSSKREYNRLFRADNLYFAWAMTAEDKNLINFAEAIGAEYYTTCDRLVGKHRGDVKLENKKHTGSLQGYVFAVTTKQADMFEKAALMPSMKYSRRFEHYDLNKIKQQEQQEIIDKLAEENNA